MKNWRFRLFVLALLYFLDLAFGFLIVGVVPYPDCYLAAMVAGVITVSGMYMIFRQNTLITRLMWLQTIWVVVHSLGLILWLWYFPPYFYDNVQLILNGVQIAIILWAPGDDQDRFTDNFRRISGGLRRFGMLRDNHTGENR